jgi:hypothetical protein
LMTSKCWKLLSSVRTAIGAGERDFTPRSLAALKRRGQKYGRRRFCAAAPFPCPNPFELDFAAAPVYI